MPPQLGDVGLCGLRAPAANRASFNRAHREVTPECVNGRPER